ncbi:MAG: caspase family protein [Saprospiraceae bacterium]
MTVAGDGAILWDNKGYELKKIGGQGRWVSYAAFSPNGEQIITCEDRTVKIWDLNGQLIREFPHDLPVYFGAFSPDGKNILTGDHGGVDRLWDLDGSMHAQWVGRDSSRHFSAFTPDGQAVLAVYSFGAAILRDLNGREIQTLDFDTWSLCSVAISPTDPTIFIGRQEHTAALWDLKGNKLQEFGDSKYEYLGCIGPAAFSPNGQYLITAGKDQSFHHSVSLWNLQGDLIRKLATSDTYITNLNFSPSGEEILTGNDYAEVKLWDRTGKEKMSFQGHSNPISALSLSWDEQLLRVGSRDGSLMLLDIATGQLSSLRAHEEWVTTIAWSDNGRRIVTGSTDGSTIIWDDQGNILQRFSLPETTILHVAIAPDGQTFLTGGSDYIARLWHIDGEKRKAFEGHTHIIYTSAFSPDGNHILTGSRDATAILWDEQANKVATLRGHAYDVLSSAFSVDGRLILTGSFDGTAKLWDLQGSELQSFAGHQGAVESVNFSPDGRYILTGSDDYTAKLWDIMGKEIRAYMGHTAKVFAANFSPDGQYIVTASEDRTIKLWKTDNGQLLATVYLFRRGHGWAVTTPDGRFDGDEAGLGSLHYVVDLEAIPLDRLKERYYEPGLLSKIMGFNKEPLRDVSAFDYVPLYPKAAIQLNDSQLSISLTERSGGIGRTALYINGKEVVENINPDNQLHFGINLNDYRQYFATDQAGEVGIITYNAEGWLGSRLETVSYLPQQIEEITLAVQPRIFALCVGTADYAGGTSLDLAYAEEDAQQMARALQIGAHTLLNDPAEVQIKLLSTCLEQDCPDAQRPTKANIKAAFEKLAQEIRPEDVFILYLSGHGKTYEDYFYYLTQDMQSDYLTDPDIRESSAISTAEFATWLNAIPARKQVMMIDACSSGKFNQDLALLVQKDIPGSQIRALDRLRDRTGVFVISGSANDQASYEASPYGMGLLTYSLLLGITGGALQEGEIVDVENLFKFAEENVPVLAEDVGAIQTPKFWKPEGSKSFPIGRMTQEVQQQLTLPAPKPVFARASFFNPQARRDNLNLSGIVNAQLRDFALAKGEDKVFLFVDADSHPNAFQLSGTYSIQDEQIVIEAVVFKGETQVGEDILLKMDKGDLNVLTRKVISEAYERLR